MNSRNTSAYQVAFGGIMAALAVVLQCLGGLIPVATYVTPMLCCILLQMVLNLCGSRIGWAWYGTVAILSVLMAPDKEAAAVFACLGYYPILKPKFDGLPGSRLWKAIYFNVVILALYWVMLHIFGLAAVQQDLGEMSIAMLVVLLLLGNFTFFMLDKLLSAPKWRRFAHGK